MRKFVGRSNELRLLAQAAESPHSAFIPIYGRRRVGKSELILKFMNDRPGVYYLGKQSPPGLQVREFLEQASVALDMPLLAELRIDDWSTGAEYRRRAMAQRRIRTPSWSLPWTSSSGSPRRTRESSPHCRSAGTGTGSRRVGWYSCCAGPTSDSWSGRSSADRVPCSDAARRRSTCSRSTTGKPPYSIRDGRASIRRRRTSWSAASPSTCCASTTGDPSTRTSAKTCSTNSPRCSTNPRSCFGRNSARSRRTTPCSFAIASGGANRARRRRNHGPP